MSCFMSPRIRGSTMAVCCPRCGRRELRVLEVDRRRLDHVPRLADVKPQVVAQHDPIPRQCIAHRIRRSIAGRTRTRRRFCCGVHQSLSGENRELRDTEKGIYRFDDLVVLRTAKMPAVLFEAGVIVNREEEALLVDPVFQNRLALSVARSVTNFCEGRGICRNCPGC
jgi:hypothetical protein